MSDICTITATGRIGRDAETRPAGKSTVTAFNLAVSCGYGDNETTTWLRCSIWGERGAKIAQYLRKGSAVVVTGEFSTRTWTTKEGVERLECEVRVSDVKLPPKGEPKQREPGSDDDQDFPF